MEREIGIEGYLTTTEGVGGILKSTAEDFIVEEISEPPERSDDGRFAVASLRVTNWETNRLVRQLAKALHVSRRRIGYAGTKDKRARTTQWFSFEGLDPEVLRRLQLKDVEVLDAYRSEKALEIGDLLGNRFDLVVRRLGAPAETTAGCVAETRRQLLAVRGFPNFFGVQRFGSIRPVTHLVGWHIVRGEFKEAVGTYVAHPIEGEDLEAFETRQALEETGDVREALRTFPKPFTFEKAILNHLVAHPDDYVGGLRQLPPNLLMMFVHAYQSWLFNRILSERLRRGLPIHLPVVGDLVLPQDRRGLPDRDRTVEVTEDNLARVRDRCVEAKAWVSAVLFGSMSEFAAGEPGAIERQVVEAEGLRREDFVIPDLPRISSKGTRREILAPLRALDASVEGSSLHVRVELPRGAYATCLLREFMKTDVGAAGG